MLFDEIKESENKKHSGQQKRTHFHSHTLFLLSATTFIPRKLQVPATLRDHLANISLDLQLEEATFQQNNGGLED